MPIVKEAQQPTKEFVVKNLQWTTPNLLALYAFGSRIQGTANAQSDLDLAVLVEGYADPIQLFEMANQLADQLGYEVDLLDMRAASTIMQYQILTTGERWWVKDALPVGLFETMVLSEKTNLDEGRASLAIRADKIAYYVQRAREEYDKDTETFATDFTRQDAAILNIQRACEAAIDMGQHVIRRDKLGVPQSARDVFSLLAQAGLIEHSLANDLKRMVGFRNIAVHDYQAMQLPITIRIITFHLDEFLRYSHALLKQDVAH